MEEDDEKVDENVMEKEAEGEDNVLLTSLPIVLIMLFSLVDERKEGQGANEEKNTWSLERSVGRIDE